MTKGSISPRKPPPPWMDPLDAAFLEAERAKGVPDSQIAKMLGCTVDRLQSGVVAPYDAPRSQVEVESAAEDAERRRRQAKRQAEREDAHLKAQRDRERRARLRGE